MPANFGPFTTNPLPITGATPSQDTSALGQNPFNQLNLNPGLNPNSGVNYSPTQGGNSTANSAFNTLATPSVSSTNTGSTGTVNTNTPATTPTNSAPSNPGSDWWNAQNSYNAWGYNPGQSYQSALQQAQSLAGTGSGGYFDPASVQARTAASNAMLGALGSGDTNAYQQAANLYLQSTPAGSSLPTWASTIALNGNGQLVNTNSNGGMTTPGVSPGALTAPVAGQPSTANGTADYLGNMFMGGSGAVSPLAGYQNVYAPTNPGAGSPWNNFLGNYAPQQQNSNASTNGNAPATTSGIDPNFWNLVSQLYGSNPVSSAFSSAGLNSTLSSLLGNAFNSSLSNGSNSNNMLNIAGLLNALSGQRSQPTGILNPLFWGNNSGATGGSSNLLGSLLSGLGVNNLGNYYPSYY